MKRKMLSIAALVIPILWLSGPALNAQGAGAQKLDQLSKQLNLTTSQKLQLIPVLKAEAPKVEAIKGNTSLTPMQKMQQIKALHDEIDPQVKSILTPEQYQNLQDIRRREIQQAMQRKLNR